VDPDVLSRAFASRFLRPSVVFRAIAPEEIAFRERFFELRFFSYTPVMHGLIRFDDHSQTVTVRGHANAFPLCFLALAVGSCLSGPSVEGFEVLFLAWAAVVFGMLYVIQAARFNAVCKEVEKQLSAK
jgi:hypothetical protein